MPVVSSITTHSVGSRPVLVDFQNSKLVPNQEHVVEGNLFKIEGNKTVVGVTTGNMVYTGNVKEDEDFNNFLLIHNKKSDEVRLVQIDTSLAYPRLAKYDNLDNSINAKDNTSLSLLNKEFGSKKTKRLVEQTERLTMNIDAVKSQLEQFVAGVKFEENEPDGTHDDNNSMYRPRINRDASTRDGIYNLEELVPTHVLSSLEQGAINIINTGNVTDLGLCGFVAANIQKILTSNIPHEVMVRNISIFLYIQYLIHFMNTPMKFVTKKFVVCDKSAEVNNHILDNFSISGPNGRTRPVHMKDKSLCYIIILSALGIDYEVDLANLAKDCKIGVKKALEISRILAFNTSSKNKNVVTLKLPLPAPVVFTPKRKRK